MAKCPSNRNRRRINAANARATRWERSALTLTDEVIAANARIGDLEERLAIAEGKVASFEEREREYEQSRLEALPETA